MSDAVWILGLASLSIVGAPFLSHSCFRKTPLVASFALAGGVGAVVVSWLMTVLALLSVRWNVWIPCVWASAFRPCFVQPSSIKIP